MVYKIDKNISLYTWRIQGLKYEKYKTFIEMQKKVCCCCLKEKPIQDMVKNKKKNAYYGEVCKPCHARKHREYVKRNYKDRRKWRLKYDKENYTMLRTANKKWVEKNKKHYKDLQKKWAENNKDIINQKRKEYVQKNPDKQKKWCRTRYLKDPQKYKANSKIYNRFRRNQTIALSQNIKNQIKIIYRKRIFMGTKYHVDHIIPLRGKNVSGLHVPWNLQIITAKENLSKNNKF